MDDLSRPQLRLIIFYEWKCGTRTTETATKINNVFGENTVTNRTVHAWFNRFASGDLSLEDNDRSGRPSIINDDELRAVVEQNPETTIRELAAVFGSTHSTIDNHLRELGYRKDGAKWVAH